MTAGFAGVFAQPPGADFAAALVAGLLDRLDGQPPEALAGVTLIVNTERMRRRVEALLSDGPPRLLPRILTLSDLSTLHPDAGIAAVPALRRKLELMQLVRRLLKTDPGLGDLAAAPALADSLLALVDEMEAEGVAADALRTLDVPFLGGHWQQSLRFLDIATGYLAAGGGAGGTGVRLRHAVDWLARAWADVPPQAPVILAGSTGSRAPTRSLMRIVAALPQGAVVLPGLDRDLPAAVWDRLGDGAEDHPQAMLAASCAALGVAPGDLPAWHGAPPPAGDRNRLVSLALRPAPVTAAWLTEAPTLTPSLARACDGLTLLEARDPRTETLAIALRLRQAVAEGDRAALVSPDRVLTRRVQAQLARWGITADDSGGRPVSLTPPGIFLRQTAALAGQPLPAADLLALLKHPLTASGRKGARGPHLDLTGKLQTRTLAGAGPAVTPETLAAHADRHGNPDWGAWLTAALAPLAAPGPLPLTAHVARHLAAAEALAAGPGGTPRQLWARRTGEAARRIIDLLTAEAEAGGTMAPHEYSALLLNLMATETVEEEAFVSHPQVAIWGTLEARVQNADLVILAGLNEGVWPAMPPPDPWLSRPMRRDAGLTSPERRVGLSAHDFQQAAGARTVVLSRAIRNDEAETVAARWLQRLTGLIAGMGTIGETALSAMRARGAVLTDIAARIDRPPASIPPAPRPSPRPPVDARPGELAVTRIETLIRDPYAIYARYVLKLRPLDPPGRAPDARDRGIVLHRIMEAFTQATADGWPADPGAVLMRVADEVLAEAAPWPALRRLWLGRLAEVLPWLIAEEAAMRHLASPAAQEVRGAREVSGLDLPFRVTAQADRIDRAAGGGIAIYDYKSSLPSEKQAKLFNVQLPLEGAIAMAGGFDGIPAGPIEALGIIAIGGSGGRLDYDPAVVPEEWDRLRRLIAGYQRRERGYTARSRPSLLSWAGDYDHLARYGEWDDSDEPVPGDVG